MGRIIRWGFIGCGDVTEVKSGPAFNKIEGSTVVAVMSRNESRARDYAQRHGIPRWHDDADAVIEADDIDAVYVATPPNSHHAYTLRCAAAGKPVYVEKPLGVTHEETLDMIRACDAAGVKLWVAYYRRALPRFLKVRDLVENGAVGDVRAIRSERVEPTPHHPVATWRTDPAVGGGGRFVDEVSHALDFFDFLFGPVEETHGFADAKSGAYRGTEDIVVATYRFSSGVLGSGSWCFAGDRSYETNEIIGSSGRIHFSVARPTPVQLIKGGEVETFPIDDPPHVQEPLIRTVVDELNGVGTCPSPGVAGARTTWVMERILAGFQSRMLA